MEKKYIDLHIHTTASDGLLTPEKVVELAKELNLSAIAIADHDTVDGYESAKSKAEESGVELIPAVELSLSYQGRDFHLLGYLINCDDPTFKKKIEEFRQERLFRGEKMVEKLNELGVALRMETVKGIAKGASVGRPHLADALLKEEYVRSYNEAFARYLGYHAPAYVPKKYLTPQKGIELVHQIQGLAILAHPGTAHQDELLPDFLEMGIDGIEAYHSQYERYQVDHYINLAKKFGILYTGGSDCHARADMVLMGKVKVPYRCLEMLKKAKQKKFGG
ncbi:MAG: PHP domain-containing protein, partial [candidate division Zixibacteria bacterium]|nr:PHP domain-containing protein [candidate division Zixibacteria bacterium]